MGAAGYILRNELDQATVWGSYVNGGGTLDPRFPPSNAATYRPGKVARWDRYAPGYFYGGAMVGVTVRTVNAVAVLNHNLGSTAEVYFGHAMNPAGPWSYVQLDVHPERFFQRLPETVVGSYFMLDVRKLGNTAAIPEVGEFAVGMFKELPAAFQWGDETGRDFLNADLGDSEYGVPTIYPLSERRVISGTLQNALPRDAAEEIAALHRELHGRAYPFFFVPDADEPDVILGRLGSNSSRIRSLQPGRVAAQEFTVVEDPWGKTGA